MSDLLNEDKLREGFTALFLGWKQFERLVLQRFARQDQIIADLRNRIEILEIRQASEDQGIP